MTALHATLARARTLHAVVSRGQSGVVYTGVIASAGPYVEADVLGLALIATRSNASINTTLALALQYIIHVYPMVFGELEPGQTVIGGQGPGDAREVQTGLVVAGVPCRVLRSDHAGTVSSIVFRVSS